MQIKELQSINQVRLLKDYYQIEQHLEWLEDGKTKQCALQHTADKVCFQEACGTLNTDKHQETDFIICHQILSGTIFEELIKEYKLYRSRFMWVKAKSCYSLHKDFSHRIHIPIVTNPSAMFVFAEPGVVHLPALVHLPIGKVYQVDTTQRHSFANFGNTDRLHLIGCV